MKASSDRKARAGRFLLGTTALCGCAAMLFAGMPALAQDSEPMETVTITGYRASLTDSTNAKRDSVGFSDTVYAEDIGKFPDTNIAEAFNRIPGITITREVTGEGLNIAIRGLGTNFTKTLLNGAPVAIASTGRTDAQNTNREVDLNMFPTELFTRLTVSKSPTADMTEGGAAGTVNMRSARPFDNPGFHFTYSLQGQMGSVPGKVGEKGMVLVSNTWGRFGALVGVTVNHNLVRTTGFESIGWTNPNLITASSVSATNPNIQCTGSCNTAGGGLYTIPAFVPNTASAVAAGLTPGAAIDEAWLLAHNPGLTIGQIDSSLVPRIGRPSDQWGHRDRANAVASVEYMPTDTVHLYFDFIGGRLVNDEIRTDMMFRVSGQPVIPTNLAVDENNVVTSGTYSNAQFAMEYRPYVEKEDFLSFNPGVEWDVTDLFKVTLQANATRSHFFRDYPSLVVYTARTNVQYSNPAGANYPTFASDIDVGDPSNWNWSGQRAYIQQEKRYIHTEGVRLDMSYGGKELNVKFGGAYDDLYRSIDPHDNSAAWQAAVCGGNPSVYLPAPNAQPVCDGINATHPAYPGYGTGYSAGFAPITWQGSLIPASDVASYMYTGRQGYAIFDWPAFRSASHYDEYAANAPSFPYSNTGARAGAMDEKTVALYGELNGILHPGDRALKYNVGLRWVQTLQSISGPVSITDARNTALADGGLYPSITLYPVTKNTYQAFLPSLSMVYEVTDDFQVRFAVSRTMTRPNPTDMLPGVNFSDPTATSAVVGNASLHPYYSNNIDLGAELYTGGEGYVGVSAFRKSVSGFTVNGTTTHPFTDLAAYGITYDVLTDTQKHALDLRGGPGAANVIFQQQVNASGLLTINGIEFSWVQPLDFLLEPYGVKGVGFTANLTIVDQKGSGAAPAVAIGVSPYTYNLVGYYENNGLMLRLSYVYNDGSVASSTNQSSIPAAALYTDPYAQLDLSASYKLSKLFGELPSDPEVTFDVQNLLQETQRTYFQYNNATFTYYEPGYVILFGVRGTF